MTKRFGGHLALDCVGLEVRPGEIHALVGANGSGKSTLIKILAGYHLPDPGARVKVAGEEHHFDGRPLPGLRFVHQDLALVPNLSVAENVALGSGFPVGRGRRILWREQHARVHQRLSDLGYPLDPRAEVGRLSPAARTAVAVSRALNADGSILCLVLDEPTATLPAAEAMRLFTLLERVRDLGAGVVFVSHHLEEVLSLTQRVTVLRSGRNVATCTTSSVDHDRLVELMLGDSSITTAATASAPFRSRTSGAASRSAAGVLELAGLTGPTIRRVTLRVAAGEVVGVAGLNGSGRDELLGTVFGSVARQAGTVRVGGQVLPDRRPDLAIKAGVSFVPGDRKRLGIVESLALGENLTLGDLGRFWHRGLLHHRAEAASISEWLDRLRVTPARSRLPITSFSGGNQQKVVVGRSLRLLPAVLLVDEPTQGVDVVAKSAIHETLAGAATGGTAIVIASSDSEELASVCSRVVVMRRGSVVAELDRHEATAVRIDRLCMGSSDNGSAGAPPNLDKGETA